MTKSSQHPKTQAKLTAKAASAGLAGFGGRPMAGAVVKGHEFVPTRGLTPQQALDSVNKLNAAGYSYGEVGPGVGPTLGGAAGGVWVPVPKQGLAKKLAAMR
ncbi:hypothetical protein LO772_13445 [Yinghuangia sp. ASG 101]|uniref:hypothetical protein n=1 Tax=Yinghuangia sp. ASG 101 TaxID=2896848 RepID=UPI001E2D1CAD|nr:hypothetical protein [Yinghuangia sp. ASG 101]UGQ14496.1 hypothetical protein LO772_13445 [Yinghuangia sp. ASG 101]